MMDVSCPVWVGQHGVYHSSQNYMQLKARVAYVYWTFEGIGTETAESKPQTIVE